MPECLAPAKPGGGISLTCELAGKALKSSNLLDNEMTINFKPGGIGALAYNYVIGHNNAADDMIVAASSGSVLNIALGKFGRYGVEDVRWLGAFATDYGAIAVHPDAPWNNLDDLFNSINAGERIIIGGGGSIGSQDWMKMALLAREVGVAPRAINYVAFEGGGEALSAFQGGHIQAFSGDISELFSMWKKGQIKILAILAPKRLSGQFSKIATAAEQGYDLNWLVWRGFYMGPEVSDEAYNWWVNSFRRLVRSDEFNQLREEAGLFPYFKAGDDFTEHVNDQLRFYRETARAIGLFDD